MKTFFFAHEVLTSARSFAKKQTKMARFVTFSFVLSVLYLLAPSASLHAAACWPAWSSSAVYTAGGQVSYNSQNYQAAYWTQGNNPSTSSGPAGSGQPWIPEGSCSGGSGGGSGSGGTTPSAPTQCGTLLAGQGLTAGQTLTSCDARFTLAEQNDGNLVVYLGGINGTALWASGKNGSGAAYVIMQSDGNLVQYNSSGGAIWASGTNNSAGARTNMQNDGNLVIYNSSNSPVWATGTWGHTVPGPTQCGKMTAPQGLASGTSLSSCDGQYTLSMQGDGNLVLYHGSSALWATGTNGKGGYEAVMQADGNFVEYGMTNALFATGTNGQNGAYLAVQTDGNLVVYNSGGGAIWASNTCSGCGGGGGGNGGGGSAPGFVFSPYKDVTVDANWNTGAQQTTVAGGSELVTQAMPNSTLTWAFATGTCGSETWAGITPALEASNVQQFVNAGKKYIISTGGANGSFDCPSASGFASFINTYNSSNMVGVDFDIETGQSQQTISDLVNAVKGVQGQFPNMRFSFTVASFGTTAANPIFNSTGVAVINTIKNAGLGGHWTINPMAFDFGGANPNFCTVVNGACEMGQSAIGAMQAVNQEYGISYGNIEVTLEVPTDDGGAPFTTSDVNTVCNWIKSNGVAGIHFWSLDRDTGLTYSRAIPSACGTN